MRISISAGVSNAIQWRSIGAGHLRRSTVSRKSFSQIMIVAAFDFGRRGIAVSVGRVGRSVDVVPRHCRFQGLVRPTAAPSDGIDGTAVTATHRGVMTWAIPSPAFVRSLSMTRRCPAAMWRRSCDAIRRSKLCANAARGPRRSMRSAAPRPIQRRVRWQWRVRVRREQHVPEQHVSVEQLLG